MKKIFWLILICFSSISLFAQTPFNLSGLNTNVTNNIYENNVGDIGGITLQQVMLNQNYSAVNKLNDTSYIGYFSIAEEYYQGMTVLHGSDSLYTCKVTAGPGVWNIANWKFSQTISSGNSTITLSGAVTGSGTTAITTTYAGTLPITLGGTGINTSSSTGVAQVSSGTWSVSAALANGTTATTQASTDNSTKIATDGFVKTATTSTVQYDSSTSGTVVSNGSRYLCEHGSATTLIFTSPTSPQPLQEWIITTNQTSITVSFSSSAVYVAAPTTLTKVTSIRFIYQQTGSGSYAWYNNN